GHGRVGGRGGQRGARAQLAIRPRYDAAAGHRGWRHPGAASMNLARLQAIGQCTALLTLRIALAVPFWRSGLTKWDGFLQLSDSARTLFTEEFRLHIFGREIPYPMPDLFPHLSGLGELCLPVLRVLGLVTR